MIRNALLAGLVLGLTPLATAHWDQVRKLTATDAAAGDWFGLPVAVNGNFVVVGARFDDDAGDSSGSAYVFDVTTGEQLHKLTAADASAEDSFGVSVAISGNIAIIGASGDDHAGIDSGSAYLFDVTTGEQLHKLAASGAAAGDFFGVSVSVSGNLAVVGALGTDDAGENSGSAYVFDVTTGGQLHELAAADAAAGDFFGISVSMSGDRVVVGADGDDDAGENSGSAYVFDTTTAAQLHKLTAVDAAAGDVFGLSVSISGGLAIVGASNNDDAGDDSGSAYVFDVATGEQLQKLTADDAAAGDWFGWSVSISGNLAVVGAWTDDDAGFTSGSAYVFDAATGNQRHKLTADDSESGDGFGRSVSISGETVLVGAFGDDGEGLSSGASYVFAADPCPGDIDGDGTAGFSDLVSLLFAWGPCSGCPEDLDDNGDVGFDDLLTLLLTWGECP